MNKKLLAVLFGSALMLSSCGGNDSVKETDTTTTEPKTTETASVDAEKIVGQSCISCHGTNLDRNRWINRRLRTSGVHLSDRKPGRGIACELHKRETSELYHKLKAATAETASPPASEKRTERRRPMADPTSTVTSANGTRCLTLGWRLMQSPAAANDNGGR